MASEDMRALLASLTTAGGLTPTLAGEAASVLGVTGLGASMSSTSGTSGTAWPCDSTSTALEDLQFTLGEGPSVDISDHGVPVLTPDLGAPPTRRWPAFTRAAGHLGVRALFAFPLRIGVIGLGALELYRDRPGTLSTTELNDALVLAEAVTALLLQLPTDTESIHLRATVHQASGMVAVQLGATLAEALVRLRARALGTDRPLDAVASDVVARRLDFQEEDAHR